MSVAPEETALDVDAIRKGFGTMSEPNGMTFTREELESEIARLARDGGDWFYDMPLPHGVWTGGNKNLPHTRLKRIVQIVADLCPKPLKECRILDLGSLEGQFTIEFAQQGSDALGVEIRTANIEKARFVGEALSLPNARFEQGDVRDISRDRQGQFDAIVCSGILYHLDEEGVAKVVQAMFDMAITCVVIDTHFAFEAEKSVSLGGKRYFGVDFREHDSEASLDMKDKARWASADNEFSFWPTRASLVALLQDAGFSSVYECFSPVHKNYGREGIEHLDRATFVAIKGDAISLATSPAANVIQERWPEGTLSYAAPPKRSLLRRIASRARSVLGR